MISIFQHRILPLDACCWTVLPENPLARTASSKRQGPSCEVETATASGATWGALCCAPTHCCTLRRKANPLGARARRPLRTAAQQSGLPLFAFALGQTHTLTCLFRSSRPLTTRALISTFFLLPRARLSDTRQWSFGACIVASLPAGLSPVWPCPGRVPLLA
jgi:hypothetical protein